MKKHPRLQKRGNGFFYIIWSRTERESTKTTDPKFANEIMKMKDEERRKGNIRQLDKVQRIRLFEFKEEYLIHREQAGALDEISGDTIENDRIALKHFCNILGDIPLRSVNRGRIDDFKLKLLSLGKDRLKRMNYINVLLRSLRAAFSYAVLQGYIDKNPFFKDKGKKEAWPLFDLGKRKPKFMERNEIQKLEDVLIQQMRDIRIQLADINLPICTQKQLQLRLTRKKDFLSMIKFYFFTGMRRAELVRLQWTDIKFDNNVIHVRETKNNEERYIPIHPELHSVDENGVVSGVIHEMGRKDIGYLFPWRSEDHIDHLFSELAKAAGINKTLHSTRHSFCSYSAMSGVHVRAIQKAAGHKDISTTLIYTDIADEQMQIEMKKLKFK